MQKDNYDPETFCCEQEICMPIGNTGKPTTGRAMYICECGEVIAYMPGYDCPLCGCEIQ